MISFDSHYVLKDEILLNTTLKTSLESSTRDSEASSPRIYILIRNLGLQEYTQKSDIYIVGRKTLFSFLFHLHTNKLRKCIEFDKRFRTIGAPFKVLI